MKQAWRYTANIDDGGIWPLSITIDNISDVNIRGISWFIYANWHRSFDGGVWHLCQCIYGLQFYTAQRLSSQNDGQYLEMIYSTDPDLHLVIGTGLMNGISITKICQG